MNEIQLWLLLVAVGRGKKGVCGNGGEAYIGIGWIDSA